MRRNRATVACIGVAIAMLLGVAFTENAETSGTREVTCTGKVLDDQDRLVNGAKVTLYQVEYDSSTRSFDVSRIGQVQTRADGAFSFSRTLDTDTYRYGQIVAEKEGFALGPAGWDMRKELEIEIKLSRPKELAGVVVDGNDKPVADAEVSISMLIIGSMGDQKGLSGPLAVEKFTVRTDAAGKFEFTGIPDGATVEFIIKKPGRATVSTFQQTSYPEQKMQFPAGQKDIKLVMPVEAKIEGIVVEKSTGKPVEGVQIICTTGRENGFLRPKPFASKQDGTFGIDALAPERHVLEVVQPTGKMPDWAAEPVEIITEAGKTQSGVKVELTKGGALEVAVRDAVSRQPLGKVSLGVQHEASGRYISGISSEDGLVRMRLLPGEYQVNTVIKQGYSQERIQDKITIEEGKTERLEYELAANPKITGIVRDEKGAPVKGARLRVCPGGGPEDGVSDADGKFEVICDMGSWPGNETPVRILVGRYEEGNLAAAVQIEEDARVVDLTLKPAVIFSGKVADPNGKGIDGASVTIMLEGPRWGSTIGRDRITTNAQGRFEVRAVPPGEKYRLYIRADGYGENRSEQISADDAVNGRLDLSNVTLPVANLSVSGVVVDNNDEPVAGVRIYCSGEGQTRSRTETDTGGKFTLEKVCAGKIRINADKTGTTRLYGSIETDGGATDVRIVMSERRSSALYQPRRPSSRIGKLLPEFEDVGIKLSPADTGGKRILVCFWDMEQRPSRYCLQQLSKRAQELKAKDVVVVAVQASKVDANALDELIKKYNVPFSTGMVQGDAEKTRFAWGVKSLPWLILTDRKHIVRAEGFALTELDEKIKERNNATE